MLRLGLAHPVKIEFGVDVEPSAARYFRSAVIDVDERAEPGGSAAARHAVSKRREGTRFAGRDRRRLGVDRPGAKRSHIGGDRRP